MMETKEARMKIDEIANNFVNWRNTNNADRLRAELYSSDIESIEEGNTSEIGTVKGMDGLKKKGQGLSRDFEVHNIKASAPVVADNWFSIKFEIDTTNKKSGKRSTLSEIGMYKVEDGKIVKEHYFMW
jgi:SnoaL-like protein